MVLFHVVLKVFTRNSVFIHFRWSVLEVAAYILDDLLNFDLDVMICFGEDSQGFKGHNIL